MYFLCQSLSFSYHLQVSTNGYISFERAFTESRRNHFNYTFILAPFWSDIDTFCAGEVVYTTYTRNEHQQGVNSLLDDVSSFLRESGEAASEFIATWMLVVQWNEVPHLGTNCDQILEVNLGFIADGGSSTT